MYTDICYAEEQLIDYCDMIADALIHYAAESGEEKKTAALTDERARQQIHELFLDKFRALKNHQELS